jgi:hypothetical protein
MAQYSFYPKTKYKISQFSEIKMVDITISTRIKQALKNYNAIAINPFIVQNGDRPDVVSNILYGTPYYEYILLMVNDIESVYDQWPKDDATFRNYIIEKYESVELARQTIKHYYNGEGDIVSEEYWLNLNDEKKYRESFYEHEIELNDEKARIRVLELPYIVRFESDLQEILSQKT